MFEDNLYTQYVVAKYSANDDNAKLYDFDKLLVIYKNHQNSIVELYHLKANNVSYKTRLIENNSKYFTNKSRFISITYDFTSIF